VLEVDGFKLQTSYRDRWPGDPAFAPVFDELNRRKAVVFFHPTVPGCCVNMQQGVPVPLMEYPFDTTRAIASLLFGGTLTRCPDIRFIFSHGGGTLPMLAERIVSLARTNKALAARLPADAHGRLRKLFFDVVSVTNAPAMAALLEFTATSQLMFGSDLPYCAIETTVCELAGLGLGAAELRAIERDNALRLMPRLAA
jgi:predicted TIM-barrel fold metal-dependent hydrolase